MILGLILWACKGEAPVDDSGPPTGDSAPAERLKTFTTHGTWCVTTAYSETYCDTAW